MEPFDLVVIGGGISGLSLAYDARSRGRSVCVLEREPRVGGAVHSAAVGEAFWFELGAHTAYNSYGRFLALVEALGLAAARVPRREARWRLWDDGRPVSVVSRLSWPQLAWHLPRLLTARRSGCSVEGYFSRVLGPGNYRRVAAPMLGAVVSQDAGGFPADLLFKKRSRRKDWPRSFTLDGGLGALPEALAAQEGIAVHAGPGAAAEAVACENGASRGGWRVTTADGRIFQAPALAVATPPDTASLLLRDGAPDVAQALAEFAVVDFTTVGIVARREAVALPEMAGLVGLEAPFRSVVTRDPVPHESLRGFAFHFRPEVPEAARLEQIEAVLGCGPAQWEHRVVARRRLPALAPGHAGRIRRLDALVAGRALLLTGNWFGGLAIEDCLTRSASEAERLPG